MAFETLPMVPLLIFLKASEIEESVSDFPPSSIAGFAESGTLSSTGSSSSSSAMPIQQIQVMATIALLRLALP